MPRVKVRYLIWLLLALGLYVSLFKFLPSSGQDAVSRESLIGKRGSKALFIQGIDHRKIKQANANSKLVPIMNAVQNRTDLRNVRNKYPDQLFQQRRKARLYSQQNFSASVNLSLYLRFINTLHDELSFGKTADGKKMLQEDLIRSGSGLEPYVTERGEAAWIENGMVYRPWRRPDPSTMHKEYPSPYITEYESYIPFNEKLFFEGRKPDPKYKTQRKIILWYTKTRYTEPKEDLQPLKLCPDFPCYITTNRTYSENSSAMLFAAQILETAPPQRRSDQIFILHNHEPPYVNEYFMPKWREGFEQPGWKEAFNWTMTYRMDSDLIVPYGVVRRRPTPLVSKDYKSIVTNKTKLVAWIVSNCKTSSQREMYVKELQKHIPIDTFGKCAEYKCPHQEDWKCAQMISENYKFYIGFESAFCADYVTEKIFHYLTMNTITVVRGSDEYFLHMPREIYLNAANFPTPKALADEMLYLHNNDAAYIEMLKMKDQYISYMEGFPVRESSGYVRVIAYRLDTPALCLACLRLWNLEKYAKSIPDSHEWFNSKVCRKANDLNF